MYKVKINVKHTMKINEKIVDSEKDKLCKDEKNKSAYFIGFLQKMILNKCDKTSIY